MSDALLVFDPVTIKNTFLEFGEESPTVGTTRSSSLPRSFMPANAITCAAVLALASDVSNMDLDDCCTERGLGISSGSDNDGACSDPQSEEEVVAQSPKIVRVSFGDELERSNSTAIEKEEALIPINWNKARPTKLNTKARAFEPSLLTEDMKRLAAAHASLAASPKILNVDPVTIKNTFLEFVEECPTGGTKRSSSLPRSFKLASTITCATVFALASDVSTMDSDDGCTEDGLGSSSGSDTFGVCSEPQYEEEDVAQTPKIVRVILSDELERSNSMASHKDEALIPISLIKAVSTTLSTKARSFEPSFLTKDMRRVITAAHASLAASPKILNVDVFEGPPGSSTTIVGSIKKGTLGTSGAHQYLEIVKIALLDASKNSENTYLLGYNATPFMQLGWSGFSAKLGCVPAMQAHATCWDTYENGYCPRRSTCRWCHPQEKNLIELVVMLQEVR